MSNIIEILLVEDSLSDRFLALEALSEAKIPNNVHAVPDGVEALDFVRRTGKYAQAPRPDLILLDLNLPRKDGRVVLAELKAEPDLRKIPVVILATSGDADVGLRSYPEHAQSFITKPIDVGQFNEIMRIYKSSGFRIWKRPRPLVQRRIHPPPTNRKPIQCQWSKREGHRQTCLHCPPCWP